MPGYNLGLKERHPRSSLQGGSCPAAVRTCPETFSRDHVRRGRSIQRALSTCVGRKRHVTWRFV